MENDLQQRFSTSPSLQVYPPLTPHRHAQPGTKNLPARARSLRPRPDEKGQRPCGSGRADGPVADEQDEQDVFVQRESAGGGVEAWADW